MIVPGERLAIPLVRYGGNRTLDKYIKTCLKIIAMHKNNDLSRGIFSPYLIIGKAYKNNIVKRYLLAISYRLT